MIMTANDRYLVIVIVYTTSHILPGPVKRRKHYTLLDHSGKHIDTVELSESVKDDEDEFELEPGDKLCSLKCIDLPKFTLVVGIKEGSSIEILMVARNKLYLIMRDGSDEGDEMYKPPLMKTSALEKVGRFFGSIVSSSRHPTDEGGFDIALAKTGNKKVLCFVLHACSIKCLTLKY